MYLIYIGESLCSDPTILLLGLNQVFLNGSSPSSNFYEGTEFQLQCQGQNVWTDGSLVKTINCTESGWHKMNTPCVSKKRL